MYSGSAAHIAKRHTSGGIVSSNSSLPLTGRVALITGVNRRTGIGFAVARRILASGASVFITSRSQQDRGKALTPAGEELSAVIDQLRRDSPQVDHAEVDLSDPSAPEELVRKCVESFGYLDILICNHARSVSGSLEAVTAEELDLTFAVNARASVMLTKAYLGHHESKRPWGRVVFFTSGQHLRPMADDLAYVVSKGAIHQVTASLADELASRQITVNAINPGPTETGWASAETRQQLLKRFPMGRWGQPDDAARLVQWLVSDDACWITGQVINSEGGFWK